MGKSPLEIICKTLRSKGYKITAQRKTIISVALKPCNLRATPKDIYMQVKKIDPSVGVATVYRTIALLEENHFIDQLHQSYSTESKAGMGYQIICPKCGKITCFKSCDICRYITNKMSESGVNVLGTRLQISALCDKCKN